MNDKTKLTISIIILISTIIILILINSDPPTYEHFFRTNIPGISQDRSGGSQGGSQGGSSSSSDEIPSGTPNFSRGQTNPNRNSSTVVTQDDKERILERATRTEGEEKKKKDPYDYMKKLLDKGLVCPESEECYFKGIERPEAIDPTALIQTTDTGLDSGLNSGMDSGSYTDSNQVQTTSDSDTGSTNTPNTSPGTSPGTSPSSDSSSTSMDPLILGLVLGIPAILGMSVSAYFLMK